MLSYKMDFSSCAIMPGFGKSSHIFQSDISQNFKYAIMSGFCKSGHTYTCNIVLGIATSNEVTHASTHS